VNIVGSRRLWVESEGSGEPVILLAGGPANSHVVFHPVFSELADAFRVIYYDYHGRGRSGPLEGSEGITFAGDVADLELLREALGIERLNIYGFSYGGLVAQAYALAHSNRVSRLVLANTLHSPEMWQRNHENINREVENQFPEVWAEIQRLRVSGMPSSHPDMQVLFARHGGIVRWFNPAHSNRLLSEPGSRNPELYYNFVGPDIEFFISGEVSRIPDFRPRLKDLTMPVLILAGRFDRALYPKLQMEFTRACPQARFVMLERSGTWGHLEEPDVVMPLLREFLTS
jgi:proline iminopeptidase